jgi:hypothetical protein
MGKALIVVGFVIVGVGVLMQLGVPLGRLPGDLTFRRGNATFYFPIVTCLVVSIVLSLVLVALKK